MISQSMFDRRLLAFLGATAALLMLVGLASNADDFDLGTLGEPTANSQQTTTGDIDRERNADIPAAEATDVDVDGELPSWFLWIVAGLAALGALWLLSRQRLALMLGKRRMADAATESRMSQQEQAAAIADFADDLIGELELGGEPRLAIQRAYAAVETGFGTRELRRKPAETPLIYLDRIFGRRAQAGPALGRLTDLFQVARFSSEPVDEPMRGEAIEALREIRDQYRAIGRVKVRT